MIKVNKRYRVWNKDKRAYDYLVTDPKEDGVYSVRQYVRGENGDLVLDNRMLFNSFVDVRQEYAELNLVEY